MTSAQAITVGISIILILPLIVAGIIIWISRQIRGGSGSSNPGPSESSLDRIDLDRLVLPPLPPQAPHLEVYGIPCQLGVLILAPAGRGVGLPPRDRWRELLDRQIPGLAQLVDYHRPVFRLWDDQISHHGFVRTCFATLHTEDAVPRTNRWYRLAGRGDWQGQPFLWAIAAAGAGAPLDPLEIEHAGKWRDVLSIR